MTATFFFLARVLSGSSYVLYLCERESANICRLYLPEVCARACAVGLIHAVPCGEPFLLTYTVHHDTFRTGGFHQEDKFM